MTERRVSECRSCKEPIIWVRTRKGKRMPMDEAPDPSGRFVINGEESDGTPTVAWLTETDAEKYTGDTYQSHFKTCPNAGEHRK